MSSASANSSASKKEVKQKTILPKLRVVGGGISIREFDKSYAVYIDPENVLDFPEPTKELAKSVGTFTKIVDENGKIIKRVDNKTKTEYILSDKTGKIKVRKVKEQEEK